MQAWIEGIGVLAPGLPDWTTARAVLRGEAAHEAVAAAIPASPWLPPAERRRTGTAVRLALAVGREAVEHCGRARESLATVFTSSGGDGDNVHALCETLASDDREVSPTRFHNSVHNAPAGYWGVATGCREPSTSLCAHDASFAAGLLEALAWVSQENTAVLLVAYDTPYPEPLHAVRPIAASVGIALVLAPQRTDRAIAGVRFEGIGAAGVTSALTPSPATPSPLAPSLEALRAGVPAARGLTLLRALALGEPAAHCDYLDGRVLRLAVQPC